ncbi:UPF0605 protein CG18335-like isoform X2 [Leptidea sinapis]|uniref:UPF0605 protein CG18335-like isoform X2 n=1 Tax=Leptidea sinapis TaxID=189913 RepID=UPI0021257675|nr:UPF0605 protein CG18335-like isoform X2 [Leptidea sinapis]
MALDLVSIAQPHYIPGYTGHCPEYKYRIGDTYGSTTHKILLDPSVNHSERLVLSDRTADDFQIFRPPQTDIDIVNARFRNGDPVYKHPMIPGYEGFAGHVPYGFQRFGDSSKKLTNSALCDFSSNYRRRQSTEWAPVNVVKPDPPMSINPTEIYHKHVGMLPNYAGHVPGCVFRFGKTYGNDTRDAKRWLRGDFTS